MTKDQVDQLEKERLDAEAAPLPENDNEDGDFL